MGEEGSRYQFNIEPARSKHAISNGLADMWWKTIRAEGGTNLERARKKINVGNAGVNAWTRRPRIIISSSIEENNQPGRAWGKQASEQRKETVHVEPKEESPSVSTASNVTTLSCVEELQETVAKMKREQAEVDEFMKNSYVFQKEVTATIKGMGEQQTKLLAAMKEMETRMMAMVTEIAEVVKMKYRGGKETEGGSTGDM